MKVRRQSAVEDMFRPLLRGGTLLGHARKFRFGWRWYHLVITSSRTYISVGQAEVAALQGPPYFLIRVTGWQTLLLKPKTGSLGIGARRLL